MTNALLLVLQNKAPENLKNPNCPSAIKQEAPKCLKAVDVRVQKGNRSSRDAQDFVLTTRRHLLSEAEGSWIDQYQSTPARRPGAQLANGSPQR